MNVVYLDNAATSWPKPPQVAQAMADFLEHSGGNPGRSGHRLSIAAGLAVLEAREAVANLVHIDDPFRVIFTLNATHALNLALFGLLRPGDRVVTTSMEHNSLMRPLRELERRGVAISVVPCDHQGLIQLDVWRQELARGATLACATHASNVTGTIQPVVEMGLLAHEADALFLVDGAQTVGALPLDLQAAHIDLLAFTGHKALLGPTGTGGLVLAPGFPPERLQPLVRGGTGSRSEREEHPDMLPDRFEAGTPNGVGLAGLRAAIDFLTDQRIESVRQAEVAVEQELWDGLAAIPGVHLYGPAAAERRTSTFSLRIDGMRVDEVGLRLDEDFSILTRVGLHCAPAAHRTLGTFPEGTVRLAAGVFTTREDVQRVISAVSEVAASAAHAPRVPPCVEASAATRGRSGKEA
ncbi:MAG: aminotransferase class V-fold PLP-dependent enzyme [Gaiellales bacterium]|nr:aminotransferase class V-fold PLP-dependent enzyme [Gaiellales bacterium]